MAAPTALTHSNHQARSPRSAGGDRALLGRAGQSGRRRGATTCAWCGRQLPPTRGSQPRLTCSPSCRSSLSRAKRRSCAQLLEDAFGMPRDVAERLLKAAGLPEVEIRLNQLGWRWQARPGAWEREGIAARAA